MNLAASYAVARMLASRPVQRKRAFVLGSNVPPKPVASALCVGPSSRPDLSCPYRARRPAHQCAASVEPDNHGGDDGR